MLIFFKMKKSELDFKSLIKNVYVEEFLDLYFFRIFAFLLVKIIQRFPITPNQLSGFSIFTAGLSGFYYSRGDKGSFIIAGIMYGFARVLDCSDGMIARLKNNGSPFGRIIDGTMDYISATLVFIGLCLGLSRMHFQTQFPVWLLVLISGCCMALHSLIIDYYKCQFVIHAKGNDISLLQNKNFFPGESSPFNKKKEKLFMKIIIFLYVKYLHVQRIWKSSQYRYNSQHYFKLNKKIIRWWNFIGSSTYIFVLMISSFLYKPEIFFYYSLIAANIWLMFLFLFQSKINHKIIREVDSTKN